MPERTIAATVANGIVGVSASIFAVISTYQEQFEWWVRNVAGVAGLVVTLITLYKVLTSKTK